MKSFCSLFEIINFKVNEVIETQFKSISNKVKQILKECLAKSSFIKFNCAKFNKSLQRML